MAFDPAQTQELAERFEEVRKRGLVPRAILLSGGGNDIAGDEFGVLLNHKLSGLDPLNARVVEGVPADRVLHAYATLIAFVTRLSRDCFGREVRVVIHGYGNAVPDGRGFLGGSWKLPGPWLEPGFRRKGYADLHERIKVMEDLIDRFNRLLAALPGQPGFGHVRYRDVRRLLPNDSGYRRWWDNELHPSSRGFQAVAADFDAAITGP
jgi:lysophospholipase L1-like esterase